MERFAEFYRDAAARMRDKNERWGQALFNRLSETYPELAEQVRGTDKDPFYAKTDDDPRLVNFYAFIEHEWASAIHDDACPGCGCKPGEGRTKDCKHPDGCGSSFYDME